MDEGKRKPRIKPHEEEDDWDWKKAQIDLEKEEEEPEDEKEIEEYPWEDIDDLPDALENTQEGEENG